MRLRTLALSLSLGACVLAAAPAARAEGEPAAAPAGILPASTDFVLANGMRVFLVPDHEVPLVGFEMRLAGGTSEDPVGKEGATSLLGALMNKGAGDRDAKKFQEDLEFVGGALGASASLRWVSVGGQFLKGDLDLAMELLGDVVLRPRLDADEFAKEKGLAVDGLAAAREEPQQLVPRYFAHWLFGAHPWGRPWSGDETSLPGITLDDVKAAAARQLAPQRAWLAVAGDFDAADMRKRVEARFGAWKSDAPAAVPAPAWAGSAGGHVLLVDKPDAMQTYFQFGNLGFPKSDPDFPSRSVANAVLGERFTSRLNQTLRTDKGFTYGAYSTFDDGRRGLFWVGSQGTSTATTAECLPLAAKLYADFLETGLTAEELVSTKSYIAGRYGLGFETGAQQAATILDLAFDGLPRDLVDGYLARVDALTLDEVNRVVRERFPRRLDWVVIGRADVCRPVVEQLGAVTECKVTDPGFGPLPK